MKSFPKRLYDELVSSDYARQTQVRTLKNAKIQYGSNILDVGGFPFTFGEKLTQMGCTVTVQTLPLSNLSPGLYSVAGNDRLIICLCELDQLTDYLDAETFDSITCFEVIEHFSIYPEALFNAIRKLGKPNSQLVLSTPNVASYTNILKLIFNRNIFYKYSNLKHTRHYHEYTTRQLRDVLTWEGFMVDNIKVTNPYLDNKFLKFIDWVFRRYSKVIYVEARKSKSHLKQKSKCASIYQAHTYE